MTADALRRLLSRIETVRIGVVGDHCLDAYWLFDETHIEHAVETGKPTHAIRGQQYELGGAGNVVANVAALGVDTARAFGVIGDDVFGREMLARMLAAGVDVSGMIVQNHEWATSVYAKPYVDLTEQERIDFGRFNVLAEGTADVLLATLDAALGELDGLIINQQLRQGIHTDYMIAGLQTLIDKHGEKVFLLDARDISDRYGGVIRKLNAAEAARVCGDVHEVNQVPQLSAYAKAIHGRTGKPVIITRADRGILAYDGTTLCEAPGVLIVDPIDAVGAGDTTASALTSALAAGADLQAAIEFGNYAAAVIVRKLRQTGTAGPQEIIDLAGECDYLYRPELAEDIRKAAYWEGTEIEIVSRDALGAAVRHVIFDHDGTISSLREGWEQIMEPMMVRAILADQYDDAPEGLYHGVVDRVREYIEQSTGVETIVQMEALVRMVREFGVVEPASVLDAIGYKTIYNRALMDMVNRRLDKLGRGELGCDDFTIHGAVDFLKTLHERGVRLYLASGTDHADVVREAEILGYAAYFDGRIYGWAGQGTGSAKKRVIERILRENDLSGETLACVGDGPVELRLCKKAGGLAIGLASDEVRRYGLNRTKRSRLIRAGADVVVSDFSQRDRLLALVFDAGA